MFSAAFSFWYVLIGLVKYSIDGQVRVCALCWLRIIAEMIRVGLFWYWPIGWRCIAWPTAQSSTCTAIDSQQRQELFLVWSIRIGNNSISSPYLSFLSPPLLLMQDTVSTVPNEQAGSSCSSTNFSLPTLNSELWSMSNSQFLDVHEKFDTDLASPRLTHRHHESCRNLLQQRLCL